MIFDSYIDTTDDSGYLIAVGICCLVFFVLEYLMPNTTEDQIVILNCSGRGDKDMKTISENL